MGPAIHACLHIEHQAAPAEQATADQTAAADRPHPSFANRKRDPASRCLPLSPGIRADLIQSMSRDLAAMGRQIEQLKASIAELKSNQQSSSPGDRENDRGKARRDQVSRSAPCRAA